MVIDMSSFTAADRLGDFCPYLPELLPAAWLTIAIEVPLFCLCGYRRLYACLYFAGVNLISNLLLNEFLLATSGGWHWEIILPSEAVAVLLEFALCCYGLDYGSARKLFATLVFTNSASFMGGMLLV